MILVFVCLLDDLILAFLLQQYEMGNRWTRTLIHYHPKITNEPINQVCQLILQSFQKQIV